MADELTQAGSTAYTYDQNGNELSAGSRTFAYDLANRVKTTTLGSTTTTYTYDGDGKRLQASTGTQASKKTNFLWDVSQGLSQLALERDGNNSLLRRYTYGARRISQTAGNNTSYFLHDGLGSVANLTSSSGATQWTWSYEPFGSISTEQKASGNQPDNLMRFTGEYLDPTGLYHLRARQYDPVSARFLSRDPLAGPQRSPFTSFFVYAEDRPTLLTDPLGLYTFGGCVVENASIGAFGIGVSVEVTLCAQVSSSGEVGVSGTFGAGKSTGTGAFIGVAGQVSNATCIRDLEGLFVEAGGSAAAGHGATVSAALGPGTQGQPVLVNTVGYTPGVGAEAHVRATETGTIHFFGPNCPEPSTSSGPDWTNTSYGPATGRSKK